MAFIKLQCNTFNPQPKPEKVIKQKAGQISKQSDKRKVEQKEYSFARKEFLSLPENSECFIESCKRKANTIDHIMGREGYADKWARDNGISLLLDERYWRPCCLQHNLELENNSELSKKYHLSKIHGGQI